MKTRTSKSTFDQESSREISRILFPNMLGRLEGMELDIGPFRVEETLLQHESVITGTKIIDFEKVVKREFKMYASVTPYNKDEIFEFYLGRDITDDDDYYLVIATLQKFKKGLKFYEQSM